MQFQVGLLHCNKLQRFQTGYRRTMAQTTTRPRSGPRPGPMTLIGALQYRHPLAAKVSILHRASGGLLLLLLPFVIWMFDNSVSSEASFDLFASAFSSGLWIFPGWFVKLVALAIIWAYLHHLFAGVRHVYMDATHRLSLAFGRGSAIAVLVVSLALTAVHAAKLFGLF